MTGNSLEYRRSRIIWSSTCVGAGEQPPLFRFVHVRSRSKARWMGSQKSSSDARASADRDESATDGIPNGDPRPDATWLASISRRIACGANVGDAAASAGEAATPASAETKWRRSMRGTCVPEAWRARVSGHNVRQGSTACAASKPRHPTPDVDVRSHATSACLAPFPEHQHR